MNDVFERSMFAPKTAAREKLRNMGGIVASSAPLMQAARGYADGQTVNAGQEFVVSVPGYRNGSLFRINESTLIMMNEMIPTLMSQEKTRVFPTDMFGEEAASKIRPGDAIIAADLSSQEEQVNPSPNAVEIGDIPSFLGQAAGTYVGGMDQQMRDSLAQYPVPAVNRFDMELGSGYQGNTPAQLAAQQGEESRQRVEGYDRQFINDNANFPARNDPVVLGGGEANVPSIDRYDPIMAGLVSDLSGSGDFREPSRMTAMEQLIAEQSATPITLPSPVVSSAPKKLSVPNTMQDPRQVNQGTPTKFAQNITDYFSQEYKKSKDRNAGVSIAGYTADAPKPPVEGPQDSGTPLYDQEGFDSSALVPAPPAAELAPPNTFSLSGESDGPGVNDWAENIALSFGTTGEAGPAVDTALTGLGVEPMKGLKERNDQMQALFKEMFGDTEEETAREKALMFALVGAAIANGTSSDALTNIAQGMSAGVNKMMENQASKSDKKQKLKYAAFNAALDSQQRADDRELSLLDASNARTNAFTDALNLYGAKSRFDMENMTFLQSPQGKAMSSDYETNLATLQNPTSVYAAMVQTYGKEQMDKFMAARGMAPQTADTTEKTDAQIELEKKYGIFR